MTVGPTFDDIFRVMSAASVGDDSARVEVPGGPHDDEVATRFAVALNLLLDELAFRAERQRRVVAEQRRLEQQLQQAQKMEAVGRLAGGVAHDFNNLLSVILGYGESVMSGLPEGDLLREDMVEICRAAQRAAELTRQLLTFSRQQAVEPTFLDLNEVIDGVSKMLHRAVGDDVRVVAQLTKPLGTIRGDAGSVEQVVMNLVVNARDALPGGGEITIRTKDVVVDESYMRSHVGLKLGPHVMLSVTDTGIGMDAPTQARIFEPFFTTKPKGKGTGLGLAMVFGIVRQCGGSISLSSELGRGTVFEVYFPRVDAPVSQLRQSVPTNAPRGSETVLVVEDDDQVRRMTIAVLERAGYHVLAARSGSEALAVAEQHAGTIHLLLTDVMMPEMSGPELVRRLVPLRPDMRALCVSGYTDDIPLELEGGEANIAFLQKPVSPDGLKLKVREVLDAG